MAFRNRLTVLAASLLAATLLVAPTANAVEPEEVIALYEGTYTILSVTPSETDPTVYEMEVLLPGDVVEVILVDVDTGDIIVGEVGPDPIEVAGDPATRDECKDGGWEAFGFRNQGQCIRFMNTGFDSRGFIPGADEGDETEAEETAADEDGRGNGEECRNGGWEALGYRNQGQCIRDLAE